MRAAPPRLRLPVCRSVEGARAGALRGVLSRLLALAAAALVVVSALTAGRSYLWCSMMERAVEACCCEPAHEDGDDVVQAGRDDRTGAQLHSACCEDHAHAGLDKGHVGAGTLEVPDAMVVEVAAPPVIMAAAVAPRSLDPARDLAGTCASPIRAGPTRTAAQTAVHLQVFRC